MVDATGRSPQRAHTCMPAQRALDQASSDAPRTDCTSDAKSASAATEGLEQVRRVAVFRALQLGDMLCAVPALRSLRAGLPAASITLVGLPWARNFVERFRRYLDDFVQFPGHPAMPEQCAHPQQWDEFVVRMRAGRFDLLVQLHGSGEVSNRLMPEWGAARTVGFAPTNQCAEDAADCLAWEPREHEVLRYIRLMRHLGMPDCGSRLEWPWLPGDDVDEGLQRVLAGPKYVCVHPGSRMLSRRWPVERFAVVADALARSGHRIVVTGSAEEAPLAAQLAHRMRAPALDVTGRTALGGLARLIGRAALLVCNDTGVSHIAAALGTPSVVICCGADPLRWAPLDSGRHRVLHHPVACRPCMHTVCPIGHPCAGGIEAGAVLREAEALLAARGQEGTASKELVE